MPFRVLSRCSGWGQIALGLLIPSLWSVTPCPATTDLQFVHLTSDRGLSNDSVYSLAQDRYGFIWLGTADGLNRFDGLRVVTFRHDPDDPGSMSHNFVMALDEEPSGDLWVGTLGGLNLYRPAVGSFRRFPASADSSGPSSDLIYHLLADSQSLWIANHSGLDRFDRQSKRFEAIDFSAVLDGEPMAQIRSLAHDREGRLWAGTLGLGLFRLSLETGEIKHFRHDPQDGESLTQDEVWALQEDAEGRMWIGTHNGLNRYDEAANRFVRYYSRPGESSYLASNHIDSMLKDSQGDLWIGTDGGGLHLFNPENESFSSVRHSSEPSSLSSDVVRTMMEDRQGNLWFGTYGGGADFHNRRTAILDHKRAGDGPDDLSHSAVLSFFEDTDGSLWVGTEDGLNHFDSELRGLGKYFSDPGDPGSLQGKAVLSILRDRQGVLWVGTYFGGLHRRNSRTGTFESFQPSSDPASLGNPHIWDITEAGTGDLWLGTFDGASRRDHRTGEFVNYRANAEDPSALPHPGVWQVFEDSSGRLWFVTHGGLALYSPTRDAFRSFRHDASDPTSLSSDRIFFMTEGADGMLWIATEGAGLNRFDPDSETFNVWTRKDGLAGDTVYCLVADRTGTLWASTNGGLSAFDGQSFTNFSVGDGVLAQPFSKLVCSMSRTGRLFFGGTRGFNSFRPADLDSQPIPEPAVLTDFRIFNQSVYGSPLPQAIMETEEISLPHDQSMISFEMTVFDYRSPQDNRYRYRLDGFDDRWVEAGAQRLATYTNLDPGNYVLRVQGSNSRGVWSASETRLRLQVLPPLWATWWFRLSMLALFAAMLWGGHSLRLRVVRRHNEALQTEVEERRRVEHKHQRLLDEMETIVEEKIAQVRVLQGMLPICAGCKKIRNDDGYWADVEIYLHDHSEATFSHGICPSCMEAHAEDLGLDPEALKASAGELNRPTGRTPPKDQEDS